jgi:hypothetical protein
LGYSIIKNRENRKGVRAMLKYKGSQKVKKGTYWDFTSGERVDITGEGVLPGNRKTTYFRLPATGIIVLGPILGLLYAAFLPFIGIAMLIKIVFQKIAGGVLSSARSMASFGWRPSESYLAGKKRNGSASDEKTGEKPEENSEKP